MTHVLSDDRRRHLENELAAITRRIRLCDYIGDQEMVDWLMRHKAEMLKRLRPKDGTCRDHGKG